MWILIGILIALALAVLWMVLGFNRLVRMRTRTQEAWAQIDVELKRRHDLIPNMVATVQGYATHERGTLTAVTDARAAAVSARETGDPAKIGQAENVLSGALRTLFAVAENYPTLRAVESFLNLQEQLTATEDKIEFSRRFYNGSVRDYNASLQTFPMRLMVPTFGFTPFTFFEAAEPDREVPRVDFTGAGTAAGSAPQAG